MTRCLFFSLALLAVVSLTGRARAEARLVSSMPADKATAAPTARIVLKFSEPVEAQTSGANLVETSMMMGGRMMPMVMNLGALTPAPDAGHPETLVLTAHRPLSPGVYRLDWRAKATDARESAGSITFTIQ